MLKKFMIRISVLLLVLSVIIMSAFMLFRCSSNSDTKKNGLSLTLKSNIDSATTSGGGYYLKDEQVSISAQAPSGYMFLGWYHDKDLIATSPVYNFAMWDKDVTLDVKFIASLNSEGNYDYSSASDEKYNLTVKSNSKVNGAISVNDSNSSNIFNSEEAIGSNIKVTAITKTEIQFLGWYDGTTDALIMSNASFEFMMPATDFTVIAKWADGDEIIEGNVKYEVNDSTCVVTGVSNRSTKELVIKSSIRGKDVTSIADNAFARLEDLKVVTIPESIQKFGKNAFSDCYNLTKVNYLGTIDQWSEISFGNYSSNPLSYAYNLYINNELVTEVNLTTATKISAYAFYDCEGLTSVTIGDSVTSIGDYAFYNCPIETAVIPTAAISYIPKNSLKAVTMTSGTSIKNEAFKDCLNLRNVTIGDSVTSIGNYAFEDCTGLTSVTIGNSVKSIGSSAFSGCYKLVEVINNSSISLTKGSSNDGYIAYYVLNIKNGGTSDIVNKNGYLFYTYGTTNYLLGYAGTDTELTLPDNYNGLSYEIYEYAFYNCTSLTSVIIGNSVTSIGYAAFYNCTSLTSMTIPNSVTSIGQYAFLGCQRVIIYCEAKSVPSGWLDSWNYSSRPVKWGQTL